jgi:hypothetical protein
VAVVVDPIQSVKGKVVIDAFRLINPQTMMLGQEPRQTTSNLGHLNKPSIQVCQSNPFSFLARILFLEIFILHFFLLVLTYLYHPSLGINPWVEPALLFHSHQLQEE